jgi:membrane dipeptidase
MARLDHVRVAPSETEMMDEISPRALEIFKSSIVWDAHSGFMPDERADLGNLKLWKDAGVGYLSIDVGFDLLPWEQTVANLKAFRRWILDHSDEYVMNALNGRLDMVEFYHRLGVRQILLAYNRDNLAGGGCHGSVDRLTDFGREAITEMNRLGMFVDLSHCGFRTSMQAMEHSSEPVIFSHSNAKSLRSHGRNITDEQIRACAETGGIVGVVGLSAFLCEGESATVKDLVHHVDYLIHIAGPEHVGIGLDYAFPVESAGIDEIIAANPEYWPVQEGYGKAGLHFLPPEDLICLVQGLIERGHTDEVVRAVLGGNFLSLAGRVWQ